MEKGSHLFVVKNYSRYRRFGVDQLVESEEFFVGGHGWTIRLYPGGKTIEAHNSPGGKTIEAHNSKYVSLYVHLNTSTSNTVQFLFALSILDQSDERKHHFRSTFDGENLPVACAHPGKSMGYRKFITREYLRALNLRKDLVRIRATIGVLPCVDENLPLFKVPNRNIWSDYGKLLQSKQGADVFFKVENERFCGHKWILSARCPAFLSRLNDSEEIHIPDMEPKIFEVMLRFVYTGMLLEDEFDDSDFGPFTPSSCMGKLLAAADRVELKKLKNICESRISERISGESIAYLLHLAELSHAKELKAACLRFEAENGADLLDVMDSDGREYLKETCPLLFLELSYKASTNGRWDHNLCRKIFSTMKGMLRPQHRIDDRKKVM